MGTTIEANTRNEYENGKLYNSGLVVKRLSKAHNPCTHVNNDRMAKKNSNPERARERKSFSLLSLKEKNRANCRSK